MKTFICQVCSKVIDVNISNKKYNHKLCSICGKLVDLTDREMERFEKNQIFDQENRVKEITLPMSKVDAIYWLLHVIRLDYKRILEREEDVFFLKKYHCTYDKVCLLLDSIQKLRGSVKEDSE